MKKSVLSTLALAACLHCAVTEIIPSYLTTDLMSWAELMKTFLKTGRPDVPQFSADQCARSKSYNNYLLSRITRNFLSVAKKFNELQKFDDERLEILETDVVLVKYHLKNPFAELLVSFNDIKNLMEPSGEVSLSELCFFAMERLWERFDDANIKKLREQISSYPEKSTYLTDVVAFLNRRAPLLCGTGFSPRDVLYSLYSRIVTAEAQAYITGVFSNYFVFRYNGIVKRCNYHNDTKLEPQVLGLFREFQGTIQRYTNVFISAMKKVDAQFRECNAETLIRDETFFELEGALQVVGMPPSYSGPTCSEIDSIGVNREHYCKSSPNYQCIIVPRPCLGRISECYAYYKDAGVCVAKESNPRRYLWIYYPEGPERPEICESNNYFDLKWQNYWECFCTCEDNDPNSRSTHIINLQAIEADVGNNMVLTGLRIVVRYGVLQFQIQQGTLIDNWRVINAAWKPINDISSRIHAQRVGKDFRGQSPNVLKNKDFYIVNKGTKLNMADIRAPDHHVVTGITFQHVETDSLRIAIITRKLEPSAAQLIDIDLKPKFRYAEGMPSERQEVNSHEPLQASTEMHETSKPNHHYVQFGMSDWYTDSAQTTIPIFDATPIVSKPSSPLSGIGIFFKTAPGAAGVISLKLFSLDYISYMQKSLDRALNH